MIADQEFNDVACMDEDASQLYWVDGRPCGAHTARLSRVYLQAGITYFIIIGGLSSTGDYQLYVHEDIVLPVECPPDAVDEGEPPIVEGYWDEYNSGCTGMSPDSPIQFIDLAVKMVVNMPGFRNPLTS